MELLPPEEPMLDRLMDDFVESHPARATVPGYDVVQARREERHVASMQATYSVSGVGVMTAPEVMEWIVDRTYEGDSLVKLTNLRGAPNMRTVMRWLREFPSFQREFHAAEQGRAYCEVEGAVQFAKDASTRDEVGAAKVRFQAVSWNAAKLNPSRYTERKIETHEDNNLERKTTAELMTQLKASITANTEIINLLNAHERKALGIVVDVEAERPPGTSPPP